MQFALATILALGAVAVAKPMPQGVTSAISPMGSAPAGCLATMPGKFEIEVVNMTSSSSKRDLSKRAALVMTLNNGILLDDQGRTGYIAANDQFQFDKPAQTGAIYTSGWSMCPNGSLTLGSNSVFYSCLSGTFYNLYDKNDAAQCTSVFIQMIDDSDDTASVMSDGQPTASVAASVQSDGQPTAKPVSSSSAKCVSQISDGQPQGSACPTTSAKPVSQISDGQIQATSATAKPVSQISDGQIQATTAKATTAAPVSQLSDGQPQVPTSTKTTAKVTQISDGQIQAPTGSNSTIASATRSVVAYTGAAVLPSARGELLGLAAGIFAVALL